MKVAVGSENPAKINAVAIAFETVWPEEGWEVIGVDVDSEVSDQPMSDVESITGARNRAQKALKRVGADYGVGLEGGLQPIGDKWFDCGWMIVIDKQGREGVGSSARMETPKKMMDMIQNGKELGEVIDIVFGTDNAKQAEGHFGLMTNNRVTRTEGYVQGIIFALSHFLHADLFE